MIKEINADIVNKVFKTNTNPNVFTKYLGYYKNEELVGYLEYNYMYDRAEICYIFVNEKQRNQKIGNTMLNHLITELKKEDCYNITLEVNINNTYAIKLYKSKGFEQKAIRKGYYNGIDGILMELIL